MSKAPLVVTIRGGLASARKVRTMSFICSKVLILSRRARLCILARV